MSWEREGGQSEGIFGRMRCVATFTAICTGLISAPSFIFRSVVCLFIFLVRGRGRGGEGEGEGMGMGGRTSERFLTGEHLP